MRKTVTEAKRNNWNGVQSVELKAGGYQATILPGFGANCIELKHLDIGADILRTPPSMTAMENRPHVYGIPFLFPPNRISGGSFTYKDRTYSFPVNEPDRGNHIHGYLAHSGFEVEKLESTDNQASVLLSFSSENDNGFYSNFPNRFTATVEYVLSDAGLNHTVVIKNQSDFPLPMGIGFHTAFRIPFITTGKSDDCRLIASVDDYWPLDMDGSATPVGQTATDQGIRRMFRGTGLPPLGNIPNHWSMKPINYNKSPFQGVVIRDKGLAVDLVYQVNDPYRFWVFWNGGGKEGFVCAEPQTWMINAPNCRLPPELSGFRPVPPSSQLSCSSSIMLFGS